MLIWILTDNRKGNNTQTLGVAEALGLPFIEKSLIYNKWAKLPNFFKGASLRGIENKDIFDDELPDILISAGRKQAPLARYIKKKSKGKTKLVHLMKPECSLDDFDIIALPEHDVVSEGRLNNKDKIIYTIGSPNIVNLSKLNDKTVEGTTAVLIGGDNKYGKYTDEDIKYLIEEIKKLTGTLLVTTSRRTPKKLKEKLKEYKIEETSLPYLKILSQAEKIIVTGDSIAMCTEACSTGKPVYIFIPSNTSPKHIRFINSLYEKGYACKLGDEKENLQYKPLNEAKKVADIIKEKLLTSL